MPLNNSSNNSKWLLLPPLLWSLGVGHRVVRNNVLTRRTRSSSNNNYKLLIRHCSSNNNNNRNSSSSSRRVRTRLSIRIVDLKDRRATIQTRPQTIGGISFLRLRTLGRKTIPAALSILRMEVLVRETVRDADPLVCEAAPLFRQTVERLQLP
jgi:hypothetical protein